MTKSGFDIDELERLLAAATPGKWVQPFDNSATVDSSNGHTLIYDEGGFTQYDAALIVALHNSAPAMLTEIRELRAENARLNTDLRRCFGGETHAVRNERVMQKIDDYTENALARAALGEPQ